MDSLDKAVEACQVGCLTLLNDRRLTTIPQEFIWRKSKSLRAGPNEPVDKSTDLWSHFAETVDHYERVKK
jgi:hypothetical protein